MDRNKRQRAGLRRIENGLMSEIAKSVLDAGGNVIGVETQFFMDAGFQYDGLTE